MPEFDQRSYATRQIDEPGLGDDIACEKCGEVALDTGLECYECGHDNYFALTGCVRMSVHSKNKDDFCRNNSNNEGNGMENFIQPKITGYRQLSEEEVALMNEGKELAEKCGEYIEKLQAHPGIRPDGTAPTLPGMLSALDQRWISIGATDIQKGFMAVIRGIAQPTTF